MKTLLSILCLCLSIIIPCFAQDNAFYTQANQQIEQYQKEKNTEALLILLQKVQSQSITDFGKEDSIYAHYTDLLGDVYSYLGQYKEATDAYLEVKEFYKKSTGENSTIYATHLNKMGYFFYETNDYNKTKEYYTAARSIYEANNANNTEEYALVLYHLGLLFRKNFQQDLAEPLYQKSKEIYESQKKVNLTEYLNVIEELAWTYTVTRRIPKGIELLLEAKQDFSKKYGTNNMQYAALLNRLAMVYSRARKQDLTEKYYLEAKKIAAKIEGKESPFYSSMLNNLALLHMSRQQHEKAAILFAEAEVVREKNPNLDQSMHVSFLKNYAFTCLKIDKPDLALLKCHKGLLISSGQNMSHHITQEWADSIFNTNHRSPRYLQKTLEILQAYYRYFEYKKDRNKQKIISNLGLKLVQKRQKNIYSAKDQSWFLNKQAVWSYWAIDCLDPALESEEGFRIAEHSKSIILLNATKAKDKVKIGNLPDSLAKKEAAFFKKRSKVIAQLAESRTVQEKEGLKKELLQINQEVDDFLLFLEKSYPAYANLRNQTNPVDIKALQKMLGEETALIEYLVVSRNELNVFYVDHQTVKWVKLPIKLKDLSKNIDSLHQSLSDYAMLSQNPKKSYANYTGLGHWFYRELLAPVLDSIAPSIKNLVFVPHFKLGHLPFEVFLTESVSQDKKMNYATLPYLLNTYNISYNYSARLWQENSLKVPQRNNGELLGIAARYDSTVSPLRLPAYQDIRKQLIALPSAKKEVELLEQNYAGFFAYGKDASEKIFKENAKNYSIIHLAMHGILDKKSPILSSLAFTEDKDSIENNFLQAYEISKLKLPSNLVVLSACETGYGRFERGDGIASLARSFMYAGVPAMVVSLWQVNDFTTSEIMQLFYKNLAAGMPKDEALRSAKIAYLKRAQGVAAHPAFWSPFVQMGNTQAIYIQKKNSNWYWWLAGSLLALLGLGWFFKRRSNK
jgi:CHAT domain-containing protein